MGGDFSGEELAKYMAVIANETSWCPAAVVAKRVIVTTAWCAVNLGEHVLIGDIFGLKGTKVSVSRVLVDQRWDGDGLGSLAIAVVILNADVPRDIMFMKVSVSSDLPRPGSFVRVAGYGSFTNASSSNTDERLHQVDIPVYGGAACEEALSGVDDSTQFCAGYQNGECDACAGDGGAPAFQYDKDGTPVIVGVTIGARCGRTDHPYPFTRTAGLMDLYMDAGLELDRELVTDIDENNELPLGVIIGAAVGGTVVVLALVVGIIIYMKKRNKVDVEVFHPEQGKN